jgi:hypothetical protein
LAASVLDQSTLRSLVHYDPESGIFTWLKREGVDRYINNWNVRFAGNKGGSWHRARGYVVIAITIDCLCKKYAAHRLAWLYVHGNLPSSAIDHTNRIKTDNRINNLRLATDSQNKYNTALRKDNASGATGVYWHKGKGKWRCEFQFEGKKNHLGYFDNFEDAKAAYVSTSVCYAKEFSIFYEEVA